MRISIFGMGYVGTVSAACLARDGHQVIGVDLNPQKLELFRAGKAPILEEGIQELTREAVMSGRLSVTDDPVRAVLDSELTFVCVGTPSSPNGAQDLSAVTRVVESIAVALGRKADFHTVVMRSTVAPGTCETIVRPLLERRSEKSASSDFGLCFQPEFLREGSSIRDYDQPPFTIVGGSSERSIEMLKALFGHLPCDFITSDIRTAEAMKMVCNAFHALKITFANEIGRVASALGVDGREVMALVCKDTRLNISTAYLKPGFAFGGSCLPKDLRALRYIGRSFDVETPVLAGILKSNQLHIDRVAERILSEKRRRVCLLGLSFKPGTDDLRESPLVALAERLIGKGLKISIHDPDVRLSMLMGANRQYIEEVIPHLGDLLVSDPAAAIAEAEVIVVGQPLGEIWNAVYSNTVEGQLVVDLAGGADVTRLSSNYWGVCW